MPKPANAGVVDEVETASAVVVCAGVGENGESLAGVKAIGVNSNGFALAARAAALATCFFGV